MRTSGLFTTSTYHIKVKSLKDITYLVMFSDVHWDSPIFCESSWKEFLYWAKHTPTAYFVGNGDYLDSFRATTRNMITQNAEPEELGMIEEAGLAKVQKMAKEMSVMQGRLIGLGDGNHGWRFKDGRFDTEVLAGMLQCKFLGVKALVNVVLECGGSRTSFLYYQHHGRAGNTSTAPGPFMAVERQGRHIDSVQVVAQGDDHSKGVLLGKPRMRALTDSRGRVYFKEYTPIYVRTGCFRKSFVPDTVDYANEANYPPSALGATAIQMKLNRDIDEETGDRSLRLKMGEFSIL